MSSFPDHNDETSLVSRSDTARSHDPLVLQTAALLQYASAVPEVADFFVQEIEARCKEGGAETPEAFPKPAEEEVPLFLPNDDTRAKRRIGWLIARVNEEDTPQAERLRSALRAWAHMKPDPKVQVLGFVGIALPVPSFGIVNRRKKRLTMDLVVSRAFMQGEDAHISMPEKAAQAAAEVCSRAVAQAGYHLRRVEPEVHDWFFGEKPTAFHVADANVLSDMHAALSRDGIITAPIYDDDGALAMLAVSPAVNSDTLEERWDITDLEEEV